MLMQEERELVVEYGKKMSADRLSTGTSGNISIYNAEKGLMAMVSVSDRNLGKAYAERHARGPVCGRGHP